MAAKARFSVIGYYHMKCYLNSSVHHNAMLHQKGSTMDEARTVAHHLCQGSLEGRDSSGVGMLP
jgi:LDH2 family malate/lactate/ureidoglycolate dehydrogenase